MSITVKKKNGESTLKTDKIRHTLERACENISHVNVDELYGYVVNHLYDGISTKNIADLLISSAENLIEKTPEYGKVAAQLFLAKLKKEVLGDLQKSKDSYEEQYKKAFIHSIQRGVELNILDERMLDYDLNVLADFINPKKDNFFDYMGISVLYNNYFMKDGERRLELPQIFWMRVAMGLALNEQRKEEWAMQFYSCMSNFFSIPSTPTLFHSGFKKAQMSSCLLSTVEDDLFHIMKVASDNAQLAKYSYGIGTDITNIRAAGALIESTKVESQGSIPFAKIYNDVCVAINRSGKRRGAAMISMEIWHLDFEDFLDLKKNTGDERRRTHDLHTASWIPDLFMQRVEEDGDWTFFSPNEVPELHHIYGKAFKEKYEEYEKLAKEGKLKQHKTIKAKTLYRRMITNLFETGSGWFTFKDPSNIRSPQDHVGVIHNTNLCCTTGDQLVACDQGLVTVKELFEQGKANKVAGKTKIENASPMVLPRPDAPIVKIHTKEGYTHKVTPDHKVWVEAKGYVEAQDLELGDKISLQQVYGMFGTIHQPKLAFIAGLIAGDGTFGVRSACIDLWKDKKDISQEVEQLVSDIIAENIQYVQNQHKCELKPSFTPNKDNTKKRLGSSALYDVLDSFNFNENTKKEIPDFVLKGDKETVSAYLSGFYYCDGTVQAVENNQSVISLSQANKALLEQIQILLLNFGAKTTLTKMKDEGFYELPDGEGGYKEYWCESVYRLLSNSIRSSKIINDITNIAFYRDNTQLLENLKKDGYKQKMYATFTALEKLPNEDAYCLTVDNDDHLWTCNGILTKNTEILENNSKEESANCNLHPINMAEFVNDGIIDFTQLKYTIETVVRGLDNVIDLNFYPVEEPRTANLRHRPIGLGMMGWQDFLYKLKIPFDSEKAIEIADRMTEFISYEAIKASCMLAKERGVYSTFKGSKWDRGIFPIDTLSCLEEERGETININRDSWLGKEKWDELKALVKQYGLRNSNIFAIAPTACVHEDTLLTTDKGFVRIKDLNVNNSQWQDIDLLIPQENGSQKATKLYCNGLQPLKEIVTNRGHIIKTTSNHRLRSIDENGDYVWKFVGDFKVGDFVIEKNNTNHIFDNIDYQPLVQFEYDHHNIKYINLPKVIDENFSELLGYYMGDGYTKDRDIYLIFHQEDKESLQFWREYFINEFGRDGTVETRDFSNIDILGFHSKQLIKLLEKNNLVKAKGNNGEGSASAFVPKQILQSPPSVMKSFIRGFFDAEGSVCMNKECFTISCASVSEDIVRTLSIMLESFGIRTTIGKNKPGTLGKRDVFTLTLSSIEDATKFYNEIGFRLTRKQEKLKKAVANFNGCSTRGNVFNHPEIIKDFVKYCRSHKLNPSDRDKLTSILSMQSLNINTIRHFENIIDISKTKVYFYYINNLNLSTVREIKESTGITYDISVPVNNTYLANNFVSHNTTSLVLGSYPCIEPIYQNLYTKANKAGEYTIINKYLINDLREAGLWNNKMLEKIKLNNGSIQKIKEIPENLRHLYKECFEIDPLHQMKITAARMKWIDQSISHNVFCATPNGKKLSELYLQGWKMGIKTTYYLRTLAASQTEKTSIKTTELTQLRNRDTMEEVKACSIDNPDCESCQ